MQTLQVNNPSEPRRRLEDGEALRLGSDAVSQMGRNFKAHFWAKKWQNIEIFLNFTVEFGESFGRRLQGPSLTDLIREGNEN